MSLEAFLDKWFMNSVTLLSFVHMQLSKTDFFTLNFIPSKLFDILYNMDSYFVWYLKLCFIKGSIPKFNLDLIKP